MNGMIGYGYQSQQTGQSRQTMTPEEVAEQQRIHRLEQKDRERFVEDITTLMRDFMSHGISQDVSAQLAGMFYNDPEIRKRRSRRGKK